MALLDEKLEPAALVALARGTQRAPFALAIDAPLLLVRVDAGELLDVLRELSSHGSTRLEPTIGFETLTSRPSARRIDVTSRGPFGAQALRARLLGARYFAVPMRKRVGAGKEFSERVSIGRARNNDIVLRDASVSKFHAWLKCDESGTFYAGDASSHNGTFVNGEPLRAGAPVPIAPGDELAFGNVDAVMCPAEILWDALRS